jgi:hypothetical protein
LPAVSSDDALGIQSVTETISVRGGTSIRELATKTAAWASATGWKEGNQTANVLAFGLGGFKLSPEDISRVTFVTDTTINMRKGSPLQYSQEANAFNGSKPIARPENAIDIVSVDGTQLTWKRLDSSSKLETVEVSLNSGARRFSDVLRAQNNNNKWELPKPLYWVVKNTDPIGITIRFRLDDGKVVDWSHNGDLRPQSLSPTVVLLDADWKK